MTATALLTEDQLLMSREQAREVLRSMRRAVKHVEKVCDDGAILYISQSRRCWTAWLNWEDGMVVSGQFEEGWSAVFGSCSRVSEPVRVPPAISDDDPEGA